MEKCYMCDEEGITREHVPPRAFFPPQHRKNLEVVPSCPQHNLDNSKDVEYTRNIIVSHLETNSLARSFFKDKVLRSFKRSPKLKNQTFQKRRPVSVKGQNTIIYQIEIERFRLIIKAIAYAIYFKDFGKSYEGDWIIYSPSMLPTKLVFENLPDPYNPNIRKLLSEVPFIDKSVDNPQVFKYSEFIDSRSGIIYKFEFYEGFIVHAIMPTKKISELDK